MNQKEISECVILEKKGASSFIIYRQSTSQAWGLCNIDEFSLASDIEVAYLLLGLEAADAVERQKDQLVYFCGLYNDECARAAKLVEFAKKTATTFEGKGIGNEAKAALEAHKEGGASND